MAGAATWLDGVSTAVQHSNCCMVAAAEHPVVNLDKPSLHCMSPQWPQYSGLCPVQASSKPAAGTLLEHDLGLAAWVQQQALQLAGAAMLAGDTGAHSPCQKCYWAALRMCGHDCCTPVGSSPGSLPLRDSLLHVKISPLEPTWPCQQAAVHAEAAKAAVRVGLASCGQHTLPQVSSRLLQQASRCGLTGDITRSLKTAQAGGFAAATPMLAALAEDPHLVTQSLQAYGAPHAWPSCYAFPCPSQLFGQLSVIGLKRHAAEPAL